MTDSNATELDKIFEEYETGLWRLGRTLDNPKSDMSCGEYDAERMKLIDECVQAVTATLGRGECENQWANIEGAGFCCSKCNFTVNFVQKEFNFCPNCGKVAKRYGCKLLRKAVKR